MSTSGVHLGRLERGLVAALRAVHPTATVLWAPSEFPRPAAGALVIACRLLSGPDSAPIGGESRTPAVLPTVATLRVLTPVVGESALLRVSGMRFDYTFASTDPIAERDAWLAEIGDDPLVDATFTASGDDAITIEATELGDLHALWLRGSVDDLVELTVDDEESALVQAADVRSWVEIQAYTTERYPRGGATSALRRFLGRLNLPTVGDILERYGLGVVGETSGVLSLNALAGPTWQGRAAATLYIAQLALDAEPVASIARVRATLYARGVNPAEDVPIPIDVEPDP